MAMTGYLEGMTEYLAGATGSTFTLCKPFD
jgi:hypothetical protein